MPEQAVADVNAKSSTEDIVKAAGVANDAIDARESTADEQGTEGQEDTTGKVEKTDQKVSDEEKEKAEVEGLLKKGQPIPYERFKQFIDKKNKSEAEYKNRIKEFEEGQEEGIDEETKAILRDPEVAALILKKQGFSDEAIAKKFQEAGIEAKKPDDGKEPTFDLTTTDGWDKRIDYRIEQALSKRMGPVERSLSEAQTKEQMKAFTSRMDTEATEAGKLSKEVYGIEYGNEDGKDPTTGAGKIALLLQSNPKLIGPASRGEISKSDLLVLAMRGKAAELGEKKGETKEKERHEKLKNAAMEGDTQVAGADKPPSKYSTTEQIMEYHRKHPDWTP